MSALAAKIRGLCRVDDGCLIWTGCVTTGSGSPSVRGDGKTVCARRALFLTERKITTGSDVFTLPSCGNRLCLTPSHQVRTSRSKALAAHPKMSRGAKHGVAMRKVARARAATYLSLDVARQIRARYQETGNGSQVAREFGITPQHAHQIFRNKLWREASPWAI